MNIRASAAIRNNYNEIATLCKSTGEPVYLTKNGEGDLVVMDIKTFEKRAIELKIAEDLINIRAARIAGASGHTLDSAISQWESTLNKMRV